MKKFLSLVIALTLAASLTGCAANERESDNDNDTKNSVSDDKDKDDKDKDDDEDDKDSKDDDKDDKDDDKDSKDDEDDKDDKDDKDDEDSKDDKDDKDSKTESKDDSKTESKVESDVEPGSDNYKKTRKAILDYISDLSDIAEVESKMLTSYSSVSGTNYTSDQVMYDELTKTTIPTAKQLNQDAIELANEITDPEVLMVHKKYLEYTSGLISAFGIMKTALEKQDISMVTTANEKLTAANNAVMDYKAEFLKLTKKYDVPLNI